MDVADVVFAGVCELGGRGTEPADGGGGPGGSGAVKVVVGVPVSRCGIPGEPADEERSGINGSIVVVVPLAWRTGFAASLPTTVFHGRTRQVFTSPLVT